jgi:DNA-directed RNA polymerase specialized sigma24 family protein
MSFNQNCDIALFHQESDTEVGLVPEVNPEWEDAIFSSFFSLVQSWIRSLVSSKTAQSLDGEQLAIDVLNDLINRVRTRMEFGNVDQTEMMRLCRTITKCHVINAINHVGRRKRIKCEGGGRIATSFEAPDRSIACSPEFVAEFNDFLDVIFATLEPALKRVVEFKCDNWTNREIATELGVSIRAVERMFKKIEAAVQRLIVD